MIENKGLKLTINIASLKKHPLKSPKVLRTLTFQHFICDLFLILNKEIVSSVFSNFKDIISYLKRTAAISLDSLIIKV